MTFPSFASTDEVLNTYPKDGANNIPTDSKIKVFFDGERNAVDYEFIITPFIKGTLNSYQNSIIFTPETSLKKETEYEITVTDKNGDSLCNWSFTTASSTAYFAWETERIPDYGYVSSMTVDKSGNIYALFIKENHMAIYFACCPPGGAWGEDKVVCDMSGKNLSIHGAEIAVDSSGNPYAIWMAAPSSQCHASQCGDIYFSYRLSDGIWSKSIILTNGKEYANNPYITIDPSSNICVAWFGNKSGKPTIYFTCRSVNNTWTENEILYEGDSWSSNNKRMIKSDSAGNWGNIAVDSSGKCYAALPTGNGILFFSHPLNGKWSKGEVVSNMSGVRARIAVDSSGNPYVLWMEEKDGGKCNLYFSNRKVNTSWSSPVRVNDVADSVGCYGADIKVDSSGNAYVIWKNRGIYFSYRSVDGSWSPDVRICDEGSAYAIDPSGNVFIVGSDYRNGRYESYLTTGTKK